jgi:hypothetical protein
MRPRTKNSISTGTRVTDSSAAPAMAKVLVKASGENSRPSWPSSANTGRKDTVMISSEKNSAGPTSLQASTIAARAAAGRALGQALDVLVRVLDHHDRRIDHRPDRDRDAAQAHDVRAQAERAHGDEGEQDAERQRDDGHQRAAHMQQEDHAHGGDDQALLEQRPFQVADGALDQLGAVIDRHDLGARRQPGRDLGDLGLDVGDHVERVLAEARHDDAGGDLALAVQLGDAAPLGRHQLDAGDVAHPHRRAALGLQHDVGDVATLRR